MEAESRVQRNNRQPSAESVQSIIVAKAIDENRIIGRLLGGHAPEKV
jgi:hypothetical protein